MRQMMKLILPIIAMALFFTNGIAFGNGPVAFRPIKGDWHGQLNVGPEPIELVFHIDEKRCSLDVPVQGAFGIVGTVQSTNDESIEIMFQSIGGSFRGKLKSGQLQGSWHQGLCTIPLTLAEGKPTIRRPQNPMPPFPYRTENVVFENADALLCGTLTEPDDKTADTPVLLMITGSGPQNRDEEMFNHRPFAVIADFLARHGIATLRYDDRGVGESKGKTKGISIEDIMIDAESGIDFLHKRFARVGALGHSEGGTVAFMLAQKGKVDFIVSLAGSALRLGDVLDDQLRMRLKSAGKTEQEIVKELTRAKRAFLKDEGVSRYLAYNPIAAIRATHCPVLALNGEKDTQVVYDKHLPILRENLVPKEIMTIKSYPNLNHLFQHCESGEYIEYARIDETISPEVLLDIASFIKRFAQK